MKTFSEMLGAGACGLLIAAMAWLVVEMDNAELQAGKSPHSGFSPSCPVPKAFDGLSKPSRPSRSEEQNQ
ncbi:hypothetical protein [Akkermansia sp.]|uniref:hypothetical protein n=1 Tax=Akkermansia sp. TaxID=1872421 RepID=UPI0025C5B76A|nr:hypothetical protein [Akkermansia sp.]MCD8063645.1 hypothetical protein [Akkermansia sp.]